MPSRGFDWLVVLFRFGPCPDFSVLVDRDVNHVCAAADGAILDVLLPAARRSIYGDDDFLATGSAGITRFVIHGADPTAATAPLKWETTL